ncbi:MAG TPA: protein kinase [Propionibacteriaceae bacterium]|nr:protein kinase [Propionibacteriaceae bacterium]
MSEWTLLAPGGLTNVWQARQLSLDRLVAVKVFQRELPESDRSRFLREAAAIGRLSDHPGMVTAHNAGIAPDGRPYLIMELCPGGSLTAWLQPEHRPSEEQVRQVGLRIADALAAAHACGVLHRDVEPANILIDSHGDPRLADFGLAVMDEDATNAGSVTSPYAPPEAFRAQPATASGDVFSLAATMYALLAGRPPRPVGSAPSSSPPPPTEVASPITPIPGVSPGLMNVVLSALADDPAARPTAARLFGQLANAPLQTSKRGRVVGGAEDAAVESTPARGRRRVAVLVLAALVVVIASTTAWLLNEPASSRVPAATQPIATSDGLPSNAGPSQAVGPTESTAVPSQVVDPTPRTSRPTSASPTSPASGSPTAPAPTPASDEPTMSSPTQERTIQVEVPAASARPFETVPIRGTYRGGADTMLRVQRWESGRWMAFPLPTTTDHSGQFTAYVELGRLGRHELRLLDPGSGLTSEPVVLVIKN